MPEPPPGIFISYRRDSAAAFAGRLYDRLSDKLGKHYVFIDIDTIEPGEDFIKVLEKKLAHAVALIVLIGRDWLTCTGPEGKVGLSSPDDFVRLEVAAALKNGVRVIPVLIDGASIPSSQDLPSDLTLLSRRQAIEIHHARFHQDVTKLVEVCEKLLRAAEADAEGAALEAKAAEESRRATAKAQAEQQARDQAAAPIANEIRLTMERSREDAARLVREQAGAVRIAQERTQAEDPRREEAELLNREKAEAERRAEDERLAQNRLTLEEGKLTKERAAAERDARLPTTWPAASQNQTESTATETTESARTVSAAAGTEAPPNPRRVQSQRQLVGGLIVVVTIAVVIRFAPMYIATPKKSAQPAEKEETAAQTSQNSEPSGRSAPHSKPESPANNLSAEPVGDRLSDDFDHALTLKPIAICDLLEEHGIAFNGKGSFFASAWTSWPITTVRIWEVATCKEIAQLDGHKNYLNGTAFSADGSKVASASSDYTVRVWDVLSKKHLYSVVHSYWAETVAFSPDGRFGASGGRYETKLWDAETGRVLRTFDNRQSVQVAFSPDSTLLAIATETDFATDTQVITVFEITKGNNRYELRLHGPLNEKPQTGFSRDGRNLVVSAESLSVYTVEDGKLIRRIAHSGLRILASRDLIVETQKAGLRGWRLSDAKPMFIVRDTNAHPLDVTGENGLGYTTWWGKGTRVWGTTPPLPNE